RARRSRSGKASPRSEVDRRIEDDVYGNRRRLTCCYSSQNGISSSRSDGAGLPPVWGMYESEEDFGAGLEAWNPEAREPSSARPSPRPSLRPVGTIRNSPS